MATVLVKLAVLIAAASSAIALLTPAQFQAQAVSWIGALVAVALVAVAGYTSVMQRLHDTQALAVKSRTDTTASIVATQAATASNTALLNGGLDDRLTAISAENTAALAALETRLTQTILDHERAVANNVSAANSAAAAAGAVVAGGVAAAAGGALARGGGGIGTPHAGWE